MSIRSAWPRATAATAALRNVAWPTYEMVRVGRQYSTCSTATTSGTKWRSMFSIPCFSVAREDGQPEQDPCMCSRTTPVAEAAEDNVAAVAGDRRTHPGVQQLLDLLNDLGVRRVDVFLVEQVVVCHGRIDHRPLHHEMVHDRPEHLGFQRLPGNHIGLGHGDEVAAQKHPRDAVEAEQRGRQRRACGGRGARQSLPSPDPSPPGREGISGSRDWGCLRFR